MVVISPPQHLPPLIPVNGRLVPPAAMHLPPLSHDYCNTDCNRDGHGNYNGDDRQQWQGQGWGRLSTHSHYSIRIVSVL